jgi:hypothetical protein
LKTRVGFEEREGNRRSAAYTFFEQRKFERKEGLKGNENVDFGKSPSPIIMNVEAKVVAKCGVGDICSNLLPGDGMRMKK